MPGIIYLCSREHKCCDFDHPLFNIQQLEMDSSGIGNETLHLENQVWVKKGWAYSHLSSFAFLSFSCLFDVLSYTIPCIISFSGAPCKQICWSYWHLDKKREKALSLCARCSRVTTRRRRRVEQPDSMILSRRGTQADRLHPYFVIRLCVKRLCAA